MRYSNFGKTQIRVSEIGFGCAKLGGITAQNKDIGSTIACLRAALDRGVTFYDTADMYAQGESEILVGRAFQRHRNQVVIATKGGYTLPSRRRLIANIKPLVRPLINLLKIKRENLPAGMTGTISQDFSPTYITAAVEASLRRLKSDYIDIYQLHSPQVQDLTPETIDALEALKCQGKIRAYGIAVDSTAIAAECLAQNKFDSVEMPFGLLDPEGISQALNLALTQNAGVIVRGCYGAGLLRESVTEQQANQTPEKWGRILAYRNLANHYQRDVLELALQFVLAKPGISIALLGMHTIEQLNTNLAFYDAPPLTEIEMGDIRRTGALPEV